MLLALHGVLLSDVLVALLWWTFCCMGVTIMIYRTTETYAWSPNEFCSRVGKCKPVLGNVHTQKHGTYHGRGSETHGCTVPTHRVVMEAGVPICCVWGSGSSNRVTQARVARCGFNPGFKR